MKKISLIMCVCIMVLLTACGAPKPEETVAKYLDLAKKADYTAMKELVLTDGSKAQLEALATEDEDTKELTDYIKECGKKIEYKIISTKIDNFNATVQVSCKFVDGTPFMSAVISDVIKKTFASAGNKLTEEEINKMYTDSINEQLGKTEETFVEKTLEIQLDQEGDSWIIDDDENTLYNVVMANLVEFGSALNKLTTSQVTE